MGFLDGLTKDWRDMNERKRKKKENELEQYRLLGEILNDYCSIIFPKSYVVHNHPCNCCAGSASLKSLDSAKQTIFVRDCNFGIFMNCNVLEDIGLSPYQDKYIDPTPGKPLMIAFSREIQKPNSDGIAVLRHGKDLTWIGELTKPGWSLSKGRHVREVLDSEQKPYAKVSYPEWNYEECGPWNVKYYSGEVQETELGPLGVVFRMSGLDGDIATGCYITKGLPGHEKLLIEMKDKFNLLDFTAALYTASNLLEGSEVYTPKMNSWLTSGIGPAENPVSRSEKYYGWKSD